MSKRARTIGSTLTILLVAGGTRSVLGAEPPECRAVNPGEWPESAKPYFLLAVDTSESMDDETGTSSTWRNSCDYRSARGNPPIANKNDAARCAIRNTIQAYSGLVNFGLMSFPTYLQQAATPDASCNDFTNAPGYSTSDGCTWDELYDNDSCGRDYGSDCCVQGGNPPGSGSAPWGGTGCTGTNPLALTGKDSRGGRVLVGIQQDDYWNPASERQGSNLDQILRWVDNDCSSCEELWAGGSTPLHGLLREAQRYLTAGWTDPLDAGNVFASPLTGSERACRSVNVILLTDGSEFCEPTGGIQVNAACASNAAADLLAGVTVGSNSFPVRTHVIALGTVDGVDNIAYGGGTSHAYTASNEDDLAAALADIIASAIPPEVCDNQDNNCNGCSDEGFRTYCNRNRTGRSLSYLRDDANHPGLADCCSDTRDACLSAYRSSIDPANNPQGDAWLLPCWDPTEGSSDPETQWLCANPKEACDDADNNCENTIDPGASGFSSNAVDEGYTKCPACPVAETCNGMDDDCDGLVDNASTECPSCTQSDEVCDGRDNDCDGYVDEGLPEVPCGLTASSNPRCQGVRVCVPLLDVTEEPAEPGIRLGTNAYTACSWSPGASDTDCNGVDDDCNGVVDDQAAPTPCVPEGSPSGLVYQDENPTSRCQRGLLACTAGATCEGSVGPLDQELCNGIDDDCDGQVDEKDSGALLPGEGVPGCGSDTGKCQKGTTVCLDGRIVCGDDAIGPDPVELCDGIDGDCDGVSDTEDNLDDAPASPGCWAVDAAQCTETERCSFGGIEWCPPPGADCSAVGTLATPCQPGVLSCVDGGWSCDGGRLPATEVCDGVDNDCNGQSDDGFLGAPIGEECGIETGECTVGVNRCESGVISCDGQSPIPEICDGLDNDCDGTADNGLPLGEACNVVYDQNVFPGQRSGGECRPGVAQCGPGGDYDCAGGIGPTAEVCDGLDNDCDGAIDEPGPAPDGLDGTPDPLDRSSRPRRLGDACGEDEGLCVAGSLTCVNGEVICTGGLGSQIELCDCSDNDCDGRTDEAAGDGEVPLCSPGKTCVNAGDFCMCLEPCATGEFLCPTGTTCQQLRESGTGQRGSFCVNPDPCGDCGSRTVLETGGAASCAPADSEGSSKFTPTCVCKGEAGCRSPCYNIQCPEGQACTPTGPAQGQCQPANNCYFFGCTSGRACSGGICVDDPCVPNPCAADQACKPNASFTEARCVGSCAEVECEVGQVCREGSCEDTGCSEDCDPDQVCQQNEEAEWICGESRCQTDTDGLSCANGAYCDPVTGACGDDPCEAVVCPQDQDCRDGECREPLPPPSGGSGGESGAAGSAGRDDGGQAGTPGASGRTSRAGNAGQVGPDEEEPRGIWGRPSGGGGCSCRVAIPTPNRHAVSLLLLLGGLLLRRRPRHHASVGTDSVDGGAR